MTRSSGDSTMPESSPSRMACMLAVASSGLLHLAGAVLPAAVQRLQLGAAKRLAQQDQGVVLVGDLLADLAHQRLPDHLVVPLTVVATHARGTGHLQAAHDRLRLQ